MAMFKGCKSITQQLHNSLINNSFLLINVDCISLALQVFTPHRDSRKLIHSVQGSSESTFPLEEEVTMVNNKQNKFYSSVTSENVGG